MRRKERVGREKGRERGEMGREMERERKRERVRERERVGAWERDMKTERESMKEERGKGKDTGDIPPCRHLSPLHSEQYV